jgi:GT2 family glycosyltransferase
VRSIEGCEILVLSTKDDDVSDYVRSRAKVFENSSLTIIEAQNYLASFAKGNVLPVCDDVEFYAGAIQQAEKSLEEKFNGNGVIGMSAINMQNKGGCEWAFMLVGRKYYENNGLFNSAYKHFFADAQLCEEAINKGLFYYDKEAKLNHYHPCVTGKEDETHKFNRSEKWINDNDVYQSRGICLT